MSCHANVHCAHTHTSHAQQHTPIHIHTHQHTHSHTHTHNILPSYSTYTSLDMFIHTHTHTHLNVLSHQLHAVYALRSRHLSGRVTIVLPDRQNRQTDGSDGTELDSYFRAQQNTAHSTQHTAHSTQHTSSTFAARFASKYSIRFCWAYDCSRFNCRSISIESAMRPVRLRIRLSTLSCRSCVARSVAQCRNKKRT